MFSLNKIRLYRALASAARAGVSLNRALAQFAEAEKDEDLGAAAREIEGGAPLSETMRKRAEIFPQWHVEIIAVGENTGRLDRSLTTLAESLDRKRKGWLALLPKLAYPVFLIHFIPFALKSPLIMNEGMPSYLMAVGMVLLPLYIAAGTLYYIFQVFFSSPGVIRRLPIAGSILRAEIADYLAILVEAGVPLQRSLELAARAGGLSADDEDLKRATALIDRGDSVHNVLKALSLFTQAELNCLSAGEMSGSLDKELAYLAQSIRERSQAILSTVTALIPVLLIVVVGLIIAWKIVGFYGSMSQLRSF